MKKMTALFCSILLCILVSQIAGAQSLTWAGVNATAGDNLGEIALDDSLNVYKIGTTDIGADLDPGVGTSLAAASGIYVQKLSSAGSLIWVKVISGSCRGVSLAVSKTGNVYCTGTYTAAFDADPGVGATLLPYGGGVDFFILKLDSIGTFAWAHGIGAFGDQEGWDIAIDSNENAYVTGRFRATCDFDPTVIVESYVSGFGESDVFITKYSKAGVYTWTKVLEDFNGGHDVGYAITVGSDNKVYCTGLFYETLDFDPGAGVTTLSKPIGYAAFIWVLTSAGLYDDAVMLGEGIYASRGEDIVVDSIGNMYVCGEFDGTLDFDPGAGFTSLTSLAGFDPFVCKVLPGGALDWAASISSTGTLDYGEAITLDESGNVYFSGRFRGTADLDPSAGVFSATSPGGTDDIYLTKLSNAGAFVYANHFLAGGSQIPNALLVDSLNNIYLSGYFTGPFDVDPGIGVTSLSGVLADFTAKFSQPLPLPLPQEAIKLVCLKNTTSIEYEVPATMGIGDVYIEKSVDSKIWEKVFSQLHRNQESTKLKFQDAHEVQNKMTYYRIKFVSQQGRYTYSPVSAINCGLENQVVNVFPNPNFGTLSIVNHKSVIKILFFDVSGKIVLSKEIGAAVQSVDISELQKGLYFLRIVTENDTQNSKLLVQ